MRIQSIDVPGAGQLGTALRGFGARSAGSAAEAVKRLVLAGLFCALAQDGQAQDRQRCTMVNTGETHQWTFKTPSDALLPAGGDPRLQRRDLFAQFGA